MTVSSGALNSTPTPSIHGQFYSLVSIFKKNEVPGRALDSSTLQVAGSTPNCSTVG